MVVETFTDYTAFLKALGANAQVITFDDVPTIPFPGGDPSYRFGYFDANRYADQGLVFSFANPTVLSGPGYGAVSLPNVYATTFFSGRGTFPPGPFRDESDLRFTHDGASALTSAFGTFFIGNELIDGSDVSGMWAYGADGNILARGQPPRPPPQTAAPFWGLRPWTAPPGTLYPRSAKPTYSRVNRISLTSTWTTSRLPTRCRRRTAGCS